PRALSRQPGHARRPAPRGDGAGGGGGARHLPGRPRRPRRPTAAHAVHRCHRRVHRHGAARAARADPRTEARLPPPSAAVGGRDDPRGRHRRLLRHALGHGSAGVRRRVVVTGIGVVAPNGIGVTAFETALREGRSGVRAIGKLRELGFGCQVAGIPDGADERAGAAFDADELLAMNSNHRFACLAAVEAWDDAGLRRPAREDGAVDWATGTILGTGIGGMDTIGERVVPFTDGGKLRRLGSTTVEQVMASGISARIGGLLALGNQVTTNSSACSTGTEVLGGAVNCGGQRAGGSMTAPNPDGVRRCIRAALDDAGITPREVDAINGHLTATGADPREVQAWAAALERSPSTFPPITATKSLIGHALGAAGGIECVASVVMVQGGFLHPTINCEDLHPEITPFAAAI